MGKTFSLSELIPQPLEFIDDGFGGDGTRYDVHTRDMLSAAEMAQLARMGTDLQGLSTAPTEQQATVAGHAGNQLLRVLMPAMPESRAAAIPLGYKLRFLQWWQAEQPAVPAREATAGQR